MTCPGFQQEAFLDAAFHRPSQPKGRGGTGPGDGARETWRGVPGS
jgi:hypothetical protein